MERKETTPGQHWDREQVERDTEGVPAGEQADVWNRHQMEFDETGTEGEGPTRAGTDEADPTRVVDEEAVGGLSGGGQPSGESHFDRNDPAK
jgi:hypothetical protein